MSVNHPTTTFGAIALMMEAARTSETSVNIQLRTWQYIPEDSELHARRRESLKSHGPHTVLKQPQKRPRRGRRTTKYITDGAGRWHGAFRVAKIHTCSGNFKVGKWAKTSTMVAQCWCLHNLVFKFISSKLRWNISVTLASYLRAKRNITITYTFLGTKNRFLTTFISE
jgi:hypothetical protein